MSASYLTEKRTGTSSSFAGRALRVRVTGEGRASEASPIPRALTVETFPRPCSFKVVEEELLSKDGAAASFASSISDVIRRLRSSAGALKGAAGRKRMLKAMSICVSRMLEMGEPPLETLLAPIRIHSSQACGTAMGYPVPFGCLEDALPGRSTSALRGMFRVT